MKLKKYLVLFYGGLLGIIVSFLLLLSFTPTYLYGSNTSSEIPNIFILMLLASYGMHLFGAKIYLKQKGRSSWWSVVVLLPVLGAVIVYFLPSKETQPVEQTPLTTETEKIDKYKYARRFLQTLSALSLLMWPVMLFSLGFLDSGDPGSNQSYFALVAFYPLGVLAGIITSIRTKKIRWIFYCNIGLFILTSIFPFALAKLAESLLEVFIK